MEVSSDLWWDPSNSAVLPSHLVILSIWNPPISKMFLVRRQPGLGVAWCGPHYLLPLVLPLRLQVLCPGRPRMPVKRHRNNYDKMSSTAVEGRLLRDTPALPGNRLASWTEVQTEHRSGHLFPVVELGTLSIERLLQRLNQIIKYLALCKWLLLLVKPRNRGDKNSRGSCCVSFYIGKK